MKIQYKYKYPLWTYPASAASWVVADSSAGANGGSDARRPRKQEAALAAAVPVGQKVIHFGRGKKTCQQWSICLFQAISIVHNYRNHHWIENNNYLKPPVLAKSPKNYFESSFNLWIGQVNEGLQILWDSHGIKNSLFGMLLFIVVSVASHRIPQLSPRQNTEVSWNRCTPSHHPF